MTQSHDLHPQYSRPERLADAVIHVLGIVFALYVLVFVILMVVAMAGGLDQVSAFGATATTLNNLGPGLGETALGFATVPVITGIALAFRQRKEPRVALTWIGDGSTKTSTFHEGINLAAVKNVPAIFVIQNNQVALGTRLEQHGAGSFEHWPKMYGMAGAVADGNNVLDVYAATKLAADRARGGGGPTMLVANTFRMGGHATHDEAEARRTFDASLFEHWGRRDPIGLYEAWLKGRGVAAERLEEIEADVTAEVESAADAVRALKASLLPAPESAEWPGWTAGRQPGVAHRTGVA